MLSQIIDNQNKLLLEKEQEIAEFKNQLKNLESYFNDVPLVLDPCKMCLNYDEEKGYKEKCSTCCYWYGSNFEVKA